MSKGVLLGPAPGVCLHPPGHFLFVGQSLTLAVAATIASLALAWARKGAVADLLNGVLDHVRSLFGMG
ncbi:MAG: hypothetical protein ACJ75C_20205 [Actinomycetes bacterium]